MKGRNQNESPLMDECFGLQWNGVSVWWVQGQADGRTKGHQFPEETVILFMFSGLWKQYQVLPYAFTICDQNLSDEETTNQNAIT